MCYPALSPHHLTKAFAGKTAVQSCSLSVEQGSIYGFLGRNGAGKTSAPFFCSLLAGLLGVLAVWIGMRKNSVPATLVAAVALVCLACQTGSIALSVPPFLLLILAVAALAAVFAVLDLVRLIESKEV